MKFRNIIPIDPTKFYSNLLHRALGCLFLARFIYCIVHFTQTITSQISERDHVPAVSKFLNDH